MPALPIAFQTSMQSLLGVEWPKFEQALQLPPPVSLHYNRVKGASPLFEGTPVPWYPNGNYLPVRPSFTLDPHFHAGRYYVQEAGSMFVWQAVEQIQQQRSIRYALDLCAAPGGKSTLLLNALPADSLLVANEVIQSRYQVLRDNLAKWGRPNTIATQADSRDFRSMSGQFDLVLVDAPCSGEGLFRKTPEAAAQWSEEAVSLCQSRQRRILANSLPLIAEGGFLLYSTCTYNPFENEDNIRWILEQGGWEEIALQVPEEWNIYRPRYGYQFFPHRQQSEGFYLAVLRKSRPSGGAPKKRSAQWRYFSPAVQSTKNAIQQWMPSDAALTYIQNPGGEIFALPDEHRSFVAHLSRALPRLHPSLALGVLKGKQLVPDHALGLYPGINPEVPRWALSREEALAFLRKHTLEKPARLPDGWHLATYDHHGLGWVKVLPRRVNNYFPKHLRVRKVDT